MTPQQERAKELRSQGLTYREVASKMCLSHSRAYELVNDEFRKKKFKKQRGKDSRKKYMKTFYVRKEIEAQLLLLEEITNEIRHHVLCENMGCKMIVGSILNQKKKELNQE